MNYWNERYETMDPQEMREFQGRKLRETVSWVKERVPFYTRKLGETGVDAEDLKYLDDIFKLPFTIKTDLRDNYPFGLCAFPVEDLARVHASSGTTGKPITGAYSADDMQQWDECMARVLFGHGIRPKDIVQNCYGMGLFTGGLGMLQGATRIGCCVVPTGSGVTERQVMLLKDFGTTVLLCTPSYALTISEKAEEMGVDIRKLPVRIASFGAEPFTLAMRKEVEERMGLKAYETYGLTEMMGPGVCFECEAGSLHINEDHIFPEIVDPATLKPVKPGTKGELVLTALQRRAMPLLRYRTRDLTSLKEERCACGRTLVVMDRILGRSDDMMIIGGVNIFPSQIEALILDFTEIEPLYQIRIYKKGHLDAIKVDVEAKPEVYSLSGENLKELEKRLSAHMKGIVGINIPVNVLPLGSIARSEGKAKRVIDER